MNNNELYHYGVLGMKWGKRKGRTPSADSADVKQIRKKSIDEMSNDELRKANQRLELERQYKQHTNKISIGRKVANVIIGTAGTMVAIGKAYDTYKKIGNGALDKIGDWVLKDIQKGFKGGLH